MGFVEPSEHWDIAACVSVIVICPVIDLDASGSDAIIEIDESRFGCN